MSRPASMKPGEFWALCKRFREGTPDRCSLEFTDFPTMEAHLTEHHPETVRRAKSQRNTAPYKPFKLRTKPWGTPAVKYEKQTIAPGTRFTYKGRDCQIIGAVSATSTRYLVWLPDDVEPAKTAKVVRRHYEAGMDENGMWLWELTAPTALVAKAVNSA